MDDHNSASDQEDDSVMTDDAYSDDDAYAVMAVVATMMRSRTRRPRRAPQPMHNSSLSGRTRVDEIINGHGQIMQDLISMKPETFRALSDLLRSRGLLAPTRNMDVNEQLIIFLAICARGESIRHIAYLFQHSVETTSRWFYIVLRVICGLKDEFICPPDYTAVQPLVQEHDYKYRPWFDVRFLFYRIISAQ